MKFEWPKNNFDRTLIVSLAIIAILVYTHEGPLNWGLIAIGFAIGAVLGLIQRWITRPKKG